MSGGGDDDASTSSASVDEMYEKNTDALSTPKENLSLSRARVASRRRHVHRPRPPAGADSASTDNPNAPWFAPRAYSISAR